MNFENPILNIFLLLVVVLVILFLVFKPKFSSSPWKQEADSKLNSILNKTQDNKLKLLELDKLLEFVLQNKFKQKESLGSILKANQTKFNKEDLNQIWQAHKIRNDLAHNINFLAKPEELQKANQILIKYIREYIS